MQTFVKDAMRLRLAVSDGKNLEDSLGSLMFTLSCVASRNGVDLESAAMRKYNPWVEVVEFEVAK
jgi:NTP pyrophosphatase (non-canonical NTP hydrolase)